MNIQNLNTEELEQLQTLLNKMNPPQPTEKIYLDPVNEMIDNITENILGEVEEGQTSLVEKFEKKIISNV